MEYRDSGMKINETNEFNKITELDDKVLDSGGSENAEDASLEELLAQVEHCIEQLENPQISLEDSFHYYEEGIRTLKLCNDKTVQIEKKMQVINSQGMLEDF